MRRSITPLAVLTLALLVPLLAAPAPAQAQSREQRAKGQRCQWCDAPIDPTDYRTPLAAPYQMYCSDECIAAWRKTKQVNSGSYLTPIFGGIALLVLAGGAFMVWRSQQQGDAGPGASEVMRQRAALGRAPNTASLGTAHYRCTKCGRNLVAASNCAYCGGEVEPLGQARATPAPGRPAASRPGSGRSPGRGSRRGASGLERAGTAPRRRPGSGAARRA